MPSKAQPPPAAFEPSSAHVALAIAIIRTKPAGTSARGELHPSYYCLSANHQDYVLQLRDAVRLGSPLADYEDGGHYVDLVAYWKDQCQRQQDECDRLRIENSRLERSNQSLISRSGCTPDVASINAMNTSKRKARALSPARNAKRLKVDQPVERSLVETQEDIDEDMDFLDRLGQGRSNDNPLYSLF